jgi:hypothetical protein
VQELLQTMIDDFPEVITKEEIARTHEGFPVEAYIFLRKDLEVDFEAQVKDRPGVFMNGVHHARELTTVSMNVYLMLKALWSYV